VKVLMVVHGSYPQDVRVAREARALLDGGWEVDVLATTEGTQPRDEVVDGVRVRRVGIEHRRGAGALGVAVEYLAFTLLATVHAARLARSRRYDVVHVHNPPDFLLVAALVPRLAGARVVLDVHDLAPDMFAMRFDGRRGARAADGTLRAIERTALRVADGVVTVHEPYRRELLQRGADPETTIVVMNALDERLLPKDSPAPSPPAFGGG
jgi:glycosyltransferase involved in cell wall biosynthesis